MREQFSHDEDEVMTEILRRAVRKDGESRDLRSRLAAAAAELGIAPAAVAEAEREYLAEVALKKEMALYAEERRSGLNVHLVTYALTNPFLLALNFMTYHKDHEIWFPIVFLAWGIGLGIHAYIATRKVTPGDEEFRKWREKREEDDD